MEAEDSLPHSQDLPYSEQDQSIKLIPSFPLPEYPF
jgi:hypothetical protein